MRAGQGSVEQPGSTPRRNLVQRAEEKQGISFVVPLLNGEKWLSQVLEAILAQEHEGPLEVVIVDDGSHDGSREIAEGFQGVSLLTGSGRGAAAAINLGVVNASFPLIAQVDQDVILHPGWLGLLLEQLDDPEVAGAQGYYATDGEAPVLERLAGYGLELRYGRLSGGSTDHICTGNSVYKRAALEGVGLFDESMGYGYDNDMSYRLAEAGYRLVFCREARSTHRWRRTLRSYGLQQFGQGYGRLDIVARHPRKIRGDQVSGLAMISRVPAAAAAALTALASLTLAVLGRPFGPAALLSLALFIALVVPAVLDGIRAMRLFGDKAALLLAPLHLLRDLSWLAAALTWSWHRLLMRPSKPRNSMRPR